MYIKTPGETQSQDPLSPYIIGLMAPFSNGIDQHRLHLCGLGLYLANSLLHVPSWLRMGALFWQVSLAERVQYQVHTDNSRDCAYKYLFNSKAETINGLLLAN